MPEQAGINIAGKKIPLKTLAIAGGAILGGIVLLKGQGSSNAGYSDSEATNQRFASLEESIANLAGYIDDALSVDPAPVAPVSGPTYITAPAYTPPSRGNKNKNTSTPTTPTTFFGNPSSYSSPTLQVVSGPFSSNLGEGIAPVQTLSAYKPSPKPVVRNTSSFTKAPNSSGTPSATLQTYQPSPTLQTYKPVAKTTAPAKSGVAAKAARMDKGY